MLSDVNLDESSLHHSQKIFNFGEIKSHPNDCKAEDQSSNPWIGSFIHYTTAAPTQLKKKANVSLILTQNEIGQEFLGPDHMIIECTSS